MLTLLIGGARSGNSRTAELLCLVDCLTVWLSNILYEICRFPAHKVETLRAGRLFRDLQGTVNQRVAAAANQVLLTVAGISIHIRPTSFLLVSLEDSHCGF